MKKGAIELSMSTIIVIIIGITLLSLGLMWVRGIFKETGGLSDTAFRAAEKEIQELMGGDEKFYVSATTVELKVGKSITLYTGVQNFEGEDLNFGLKAKSETVDVDEWFDVAPPILVNAGDKKGIPIVVKVPKTAKSDSTHFFTIEAYTEQGTYEEEILTVKVL